MDTCYDAYEHAHGKTHIACMNYSLPETVRPHVDFIVPTVHFDVHTTAHAPAQQSKRSPPVPSPGKLRNESPVSPQLGQTLSPEALAALGDVSKCDRQVCPTHTFLGQFRVFDIYALSRLHQIVSGLCTVSKYACI